MTDVNIDGVATWLGNWFALKGTETRDLGAVVNALNEDISGKVAVNQGNSNADKALITDSGGAVTTGAKNGHSHGNITSDGKIGTTQHLPIITGTGGALIAGSFGNSANSFCQGNDSRLSDARTPLDHNQATSTIIEASALSNIGTSADANQHTINQAINDIIGTLSNMDFLVFTDDKGTASADKMGKLYIVNESNKINFYYVEQTGTGTSATYSWRKMDTDILDELIVNWSSIQNNPFANASPSDYATSSHIHGNISNDGKISGTGIFASSGDILISDSNDVIKRASTIIVENITDKTAHSNIGSNANQNQATINTKIDTELGKKISTSSTVGLVKNDGSIDTNTYLTSASLSNYVQKSSTAGLIKNDGTIDTNTYGLASDDIDWSYNSNGFTNGIKLVAKTDNANGRITIHLKS